MSKTTSLCILLYTHDQIVQWFKCFVSVSTPHITTTDIKYVYVYRWKNEQLLFLWNNKNICNNQLAKAQLVLLYNVQLHILCVSQYLFTQHVSHNHSCWQTRSPRQISPPKHLYSVHSGQTCLETMFPESLVDIWFIMNSLFCSNLLCCDSTCRFCSRYNSGRKEYSGRWSRQWRQNAIISCNLDVTSAINNKNTNNDM